MWYCLFLYKTFKCTIQVIINFVHSNFIYFFKFHLRLCQGIISPNIKFLWSGTIFFCLRKFNIHPSVHNLYYVSVHNLARSANVFRGRWITIVTMRGYLGSYPGDAAPQVQWMGKKVEDWARGIHAMVGVSHKHLQEASVGLQNSFKRECYFM